jgi:hypothetical protein
MLTGWKISDTQNNSSTINPKEEEEEEENSKKTHHTSISKINRLIMFRETTIVYSEN